MTNPLSPQLLRIIRADFLRMLSHPDRAIYPLSSGRRLALDLDALDGLASAW